MRETLLIRPGAETDIAAITAIYAHHVETGTASFETEPPAEQEMRRRRANLAARGYPYLAAEGGSEILGYAYAGPYRARPAYRHTVENSVYVRCDAMRRGIGRSLLEHLIAECAARDFRQMVAIVGDQANSASIRLHECAGFRRIGVLTAVGFKHGRWLDTVLLQRALGDGDTRPPSP
ncbi:MAG: GNAT family N-acetyltransferase [Acetobacteraceae bacterium]